MKVTTPLIGRKKEQETLLRILNSNDPEMVAVIGRRRVGKTFLISKVYENRIDFEFTGIQNLTLARQLKRFHAHLKTQFGESNLPKKQPVDWMEAFEQLISILENLNKLEKSVVFFR